MYQIKTMLETRKHHLSKLKEEKLKSLTNTPTGSLRLCHSGNRIQFYHRTISSDRIGNYIRKQDIQLAQALAQKDYDKKILNAAEQELNAIQNYLNALPTTSAENIYQTLHPTRQALVTPIREPDAQYIENWQSMKYQKKSFADDAPELYTAKGERVRSKSEIIIADLLQRENIPYRYEYPIHLPGFGKVHPDFTALNVRLRKEIHWEHLGTMDDPAYAEKALQKITAYEQAGIFPGENLILTHETKQNPINQKLILMMIRQYLL